MAVAPTLLAVVIALGAALLATGIVGLIRDGRRIATPVYVTMGLGLIAVGTGMPVSYTHLTLPTILRV